MSFEVENDGDSPITLSLLNDDELFSFFYFRLLSLFDELKDWTLDFGTYFFIPNWRSVFSVLLHSSKVKNYSQTSYDYWMGITLSGWMLFSFITFSIFSKSVLDETSSICRDVPFCIMLNLSSGPGISFSCGALLELFWVISVSCMNFCYSELVSDPWDLFDFETFSFYMASCCS